jgi:pimeloyl-ACP methyl ester carboxylesterase
VPLLVVRGANSDLLSAETVAEMNELHPDMQALTIKDRGHAPFLTEPGVRRAIRRLAERAGAA